MSLSFDDEYKVELVGNLVQDPIYQRDKGCRVRIGVNPSGKKLNNETGLVISYEERNRFRSFIELRVTKPKAAERFIELFKNNDRIWVTGTGGTIMVPMMYKPPNQHRLIPVYVDIDGNGKNKKQMMEPKQILWVKRFGKITTGTQNTVTISS